MSLKNVDNFINDFSHFIYKLKKYEYNKENTHAHQLLFNKLLHLLFNRKKYAEDQELWKELYLRSLCFYKYNDKIGNIPIVLVTKHNEILPFYMKSKIHTIPDTIIHFDTHDDMNNVANSKILPDLYSEYLKNNSLKTIEKAQSLVWDIGAAITGVLVATGMRDLVWNTPEWIPDPEAIVDYYIKRRDDKMALITNNHEITKDNTMKELFYLGKKEIDTRKMAKIQTGILSSHKLNLLTELIKKNGSTYILDIDLDYIVCNGDELHRNYWKDTYDVSSSGRTLYKEINQHNPRYLNDKTSEFIEYKNALHSEISKINKRITHLLYLIQRLKGRGLTPSHISICDSTNVQFDNCQTCNSVSNNYVPLNLALYVHTKILNGLRKLF
jgi:hypothetical protein